MTARTSKEALVAQLLGELDALLYRVEALPKQFNNAQGELVQTVAALVAAGEKYRTVVTVFTEEAKAELTEFVERKAGNVVSKVAAQQHAYLTEVARKTAATEAEKLNRATSATTTQPGLGIAKTVIEHAITAAIASVVTAAIVFTIIVKMQ